MKDALLKGLAKETENGKTTYEAELLVAGRTNDVIIDPDGTAALVEEPVALASLPPAAKAVEIKDSPEGKPVKCGRFGRPVTSSVASSSVHGTV